MALLPAGYVWSAKHCIVAVLVGVLFAVAIAAAISIALAPARIVFAVEEASMPVLPEGPPGGDGLAMAGNTTYYRFVLVAMSTGHHMSLSYDGYLYAEIRPNGMAWIPAYVSDASPSFFRPLHEWHPPGTPIRVTVLAESWQDQFQQQQQQQQQQEIKHANTNCTVVVKTVMRFKLLRLARTMPVSLTCLDVDFTDTSGAGVALCL